MINGWYIYWIYNSNNINELFVQKKCSFQLHMLQRLILKPYVNLIDQFISHSKQWTISFSHTVNNPPNHSRDHCGFSLFPFYLSCSSTFHFTGIFTHWKTMALSFSLNSSRISHATILGIAAGRAASVTCSKRTWCSHFWSPPVRSTWPLKLCSRPKMWGFPHGETFPWGKVPSRSPRWRK